MVLLHKIKTGYLTQISLYYVEYPLRSFGVALKRAVWFFFFLRNNIFNLYVPRVYLGDSANTLGFG
jgi:hypothetical protein